MTGMRRELRGSMRWLKESAAAIAAFITIALGVEYIVMRGQPPSSPGFVFWWLVMLTASAAAFCWGAGWCRSSSW